MAKQTDMNHVRLQYVSTASCSRIPVRQMKHAADIADVFRLVVGNSVKEQFICFHLNTRHKIVNYDVVAIGTSDSCPVHPKMVFLPAILACAHAVVVAHNHPTGDCTPSVEDRAVTTRLEEVGKLVGIELLDHVIVGSEFCYTFAEHRTFLHKSL